jgi:uncharacterized lipoprotein YddW (UPF0748 family)
MKYIQIVVKSLLSLLIFTSCTSTKSFKTVDREDDLPRIEREFRAAWVASVANINWPSKPGLSTADQQQEAIFLLDLLQNHNFNAVILQVRPQCDALYSSDLEPWSYYLSGKQGQPPDPFYDPLEFWIKEAHERGLELHAWLNPYRAHHKAGGEISEVSIVKTNPELVVALKSGYWWLDPSQAGTQDHSMAVALDIVKRYDLDGLHFDDYFYPYPSYHDGEDFPDDKSWHSYLEEGGTLSRNDWRRESVNTFISHLYKAIKDIKPHVKFGLSPFGIWRPNHPPSIRGFDQYDQLYADARLWLNQGWVDYWTPQLYWPINQTAQSFPVLLGWWIKENKKNRHLWPGINIGRPKGEAGVDETINQIMITRGMLPEDPGVVHWSIGPLVSDTGLVEALSQVPYKNQALVPSSPWLDNQVPEIPLVEATLLNDSLYLTLKVEDPNDISHWILYHKYGENWDYKIFSSYTNNIVLPAYREIITTNKNVQGDNTQETVTTTILLKEIIVSAVDRSGNESLQMSGWQLDQAEKD